MVQWCIETGELAKSFLWDPFFPVHSDDTLFHALLLLSKHQLKVVPVVVKSQSHVIGFVTQNAVVQLLLQSSGLEWFDGIVDKHLSEFGLENNHSVVCVNGDESIAAALHSLWENQIDVVPVVDRKTKMLIGNVRNNDVHCLLDTDDLFNNRKSLSVEKFIHSDSEKTNQSLDPNIESNPGMLLSARIPYPKSASFRRMDSPVTNRNTDTMKQAMENLVQSKCSRSFMVDEFHRVTGIVTIREIIMQFSPPSMDSRINGGAFFESALEQSGCHIESGSVVCDR